MDYDKACLEASEDQGIAEIDRLMEAKGISGGIWQSGGFTMVYVVSGKNGSTIMANSHSASFYEDEDQSFSGDGEHFCSFDERNLEGVAEAIYANLWRVGELA